MITVLTPTFNRKNLLYILFASLCKQTEKDFKWLIVDDGSTDSTDEIIEEFIKKANFDIEYRWKENGGKHTALNYACQFITTPLTFIVDSDDWLTPDAIAVIKETYYKYKAENDLCGFSFLRGKQSGSLLSSSGVPRDGMKETFIECRINRGISGDMAEVWYTDCLKEFPFPEFAGEKFLGEDVIWVRMSEKYKMRFFNKVLYISDYRADGLTKNRRKNNILSPKGCVTRAETFLLSEVNFKAKCKAMLQYQIYGRFAGMKITELLKSCKCKMGFLILIIPSGFIYLSWKKTFSNRVLQS